MKQGVWVQKKIIFDDEGGEEVSQEVIFDDKKHEIIKGAVKWSPTTQQNNFTDQKSIAKKSCFLIF